MGRNLKRESFAQRYPGLDPATYNALVAHYDISDPRCCTGTTLIKDLSGNDNELTLVHNPVFGGSEGLAGMALEFDGLNDYGTQKVYDTNQGNMTFVADGGTAEFRDDAQDFADYEITSGNATYMIIITSDNGMSWAYMGASNNSGLDIDCYDDIELTSRGWKGRTTPQASPDTAQSYEIRRTNFQITSAITALIWFKPDDGQPAAVDWVLTKYVAPGTDRSYNLRIQTDGKIINYIYRGALVNIETDAAFLSDGQETWHQIGFTYSDSSWEIWGDGASIKSGTGGIAMTDSSQPFNPVGLSPKFAGDIAQVMIFSRDLSAAEVQRIFNASRGRFGI